MTFAKANRLQPDTNQPNKLQESADIKARVLAVVDISCLRVQSAIVRVAG